jgi:hypothetical protein
MGCRPGVAGVNGGADRGRCGRHCCGTGAWCRAWLGQCCLDEGGHLVDVDRLELGEGARLRTGAEYLLTANGDAEHALAWALGPSIDRYRDAVQTLGQTRGPSLEGSSALARLNCHTATIATARLLW